MDARSGVVREVKDLPAKARVGWNAAVLMLKFWSLPQVGHPTHYSHTLSLGPPVDSNTTGITQ